MAGSRDPHAGAADGGGGDPGGGRDELNRVVAIFIPVVLSVANRMGIPPGRLMMPLGFAGPISGMMTLVATPQHGGEQRADAPRHSGFGFFGFTPHGVIILGWGSSTCC